jgi:hypothetical protein
LIAIVPAALVADTAVPHIGTPYFDDDVCGIGGCWTCRRLSGTAPAVHAVQAPSGASGQCSACGGWFDDWNGGICDACKVVGR